MFAYEIDGVTRSVAVADYLVHPEYIHHGKMNKLDLAVVHLVHPVHEVAPLPLLRSMDTPFEGFRAVGYGYTDANAPSGTKNTTTLEVEEVNQLQFSVRFGQSSICWGDSGGPALSVTDPPTILGVASHYRESMFEAPRLCGNLAGLKGWWVRVDSALGFIESASETLQAFDKSRGSLALIIGDNAQRSSTHGYGPIAVPEGTTSLTVEVATRGEQHLAVNSGAFPQVRYLDSGLALDRADCTSQAGPNETQLCSIRSPAPGPWYLKMLSVTNGAYDLRAWITTPDSGKSDGYWGAPDLLQEQGCNVNNADASSFSLIVLVLLAALLFWRTRRACRK